jgi:hypothetical protein
MREKKRERLCGCALISRWDLEVGILLLSEFNTILTGGLIAFDRQGKLSWRGE